MQLPLWRFDWALRALGRAIFNQEVVHHIYDAPLGLASISILLKLQIHLYRFLYRGVGPRILMLIANIVARSALHISNFLLIHLLLRLKGCSYVGVLFD